MPKIRVIKDDWYLPLIVPENEQSAGIIELEVSSAWLDEYAEIFVKFHKLNEELNKMLKKEKLK